MTEPEAPTPAPVAEAPAGDGNDAKPQPPLPPELEALDRAREAGDAVEGRVIGWNRGGFHVVVDNLSAFCPRSEMEVGPPGPPEQYVDSTFPFRVLRIEARKKRVVLSRTAEIRAEKRTQRRQAWSNLEPGAELEGTVASIADFGAFVDLGGVRGLVHVSELAHRTVDHPSDVLEVGQTVRVKVIKVERKSNRISLSIRALEPNPWDGVAARFSIGSVVKGEVEGTGRAGAFIRIEDGLVGLLPKSAVSLPEGTTMARAYTPGKQVAVTVVSVDARRQRIALAPEGAAAEGSRHDYQEFQRRQTPEERSFGALADAFRRAERDDA